MSSNLPYNAISTIATLQAEKTYSQLRLSCSAFMNITPIDKGKLKEYLSRLLLEAWAFENRFTEDRNDLRKQIDEYKEMPHAN